MARSGSQPAAGRTTNRLTAIGAKALLPTTGMHPDGGGLYLQVQKPGQASWLHRYQRDGKERQMGLGRYPDVSLAEARQRRDANRALLAQGMDPLEAKRAATAPATTPAGLTFRAAAERYIADHKAGWRNPKHGQQWQNTLATYVYPALGEKPCREITTDDVLAVLRPHWTHKAETAQRVRGRMEAVIDAAHAREKWTPYENPAMWRNNLARLLPSRRKVAPVKHFVALPWAEARAFMARLRGMQGVGALALEWTILTAARSLMTRGARWGEIDEAARMWTVPGERATTDGENGKAKATGSGLKGLAEHRIPLSDAAMRVLEAIRPLRRQSLGDLLFPGLVPGQSISNMTMPAVLRRMAAHVDVHGFRSTFRDWAAEATQHHPDIAEVALAHALPGGGTRAAYQRGDLFQKRRALMDDWAAFLSAAPDPCAATQGAANTVPL